MIQIFLSQPAMSDVINDKTAPKLLEHGVKIVVEGQQIFQPYQKQMNIYIAMEFGSYLIF